MFSSLRNLQRLANKGSCFWFGSILLLALVVRILWLLIFQQEYGHDAIRYLWVSEHVTYQEWERLPQLFTSPLLPFAIGLLSWLTGENLWTGRIFCLLCNTSAVGLAMLFTRRVIPPWPALAWLTGIGLALNHVWAELAPFVMTDNLFYPILFGLLLLMVSLLKNPTWETGLAFGGLWALLYLTRDNGLYCGGVIFGVLVITRLWKVGGIKTSIKQFLKLSGSVSVILVAIISLWVYYYYCTFGIISLGEGWRFYLNWVQADVQGEHPLKYHAGTVGPFKYRPYEYMEYTRAPLPNDPRYPKARAANFMRDMATRVSGIPRNLHFAVKEIKLILLPGVIGLILLFRGRYYQGINLTLLAPALWASLVLLGLHLVALVREARHIAWFFPWLYLGLSASTLWVWDCLHTKVQSDARKTWLSLLLVLVFVFLLLYPDYFKEFPHRWRMRQTPHLYQLSSEYILKHHGPGAVISSRHMEVVYRSRGLAIGLPEGNAAELVEWLYLGGADYLLFTSKYPRTSAQKFFWGDPDEIQRQYPELKLVAEFHSDNRAYPQHGRLFRFHPDPARLAKYQEQYPWAGTPPRAPGMKYSKCSAH